MNRDEFANLCKNYDIEITDKTFNNLYLYYETLVEYNQKVNLTAITDEEGVFIKHFLDSISGAKFLTPNATVCDVGTGAGFPGLVLKIVRPDIKLTLIDSLNKRIIFLKEVCQKIGIATEIEFVHSRAEDAGRNVEFRDNFDFVVSRAVANLNTLYEYTLPLVKVGGKLIAYKANCEEELTASKNVPSMLSSKFLSKVEFELPKLNEHRTLIFVEKIAKTDKLYPRGKNKERLNPLC